MSRHFYKKNTNDQKVHEWILNIITYQGNVIQKHNESLFTPTRRAIVKKKTDNNKCWQECGEIWNLIHC